MIKTGIYKITNLINQKSYIGCALDIEERWKKHKYTYNNKNSRQYNNSLYEAFRKYGLKNFSFEIIELIPERNPVILFQKEKYWIAYFNTFYNGYNETEGGDCGPIMPGEKNPMAKLSEEDVYNIRKLQAQNKMSNEVFELYKDKIGHRGFEHIWQGESWKHILPEVIAYTKTQEYKSLIRKYAKQVQDEKNGIYKFHQEIKKLKEQGEKRLDVYEKFKDFYSLSGFNKVWYK